MLTRTAARRCLLNSVTVATNNANGGLSLKEGLCAASNVRAMRGYFIPQEFAMRDAFNIFTDSVKRHVSNKEKKTVKVESFPKPLFSLPMCNQMWWGKYLGGLF